MPGVLLLSPLTLPLKLMKLEALCYTRFMRFSNGVYSIDSESRFSTKQHIIRMIFLRSAMLYNRRSIQS